jgi:hypothetical protein
MVGQVCETYYKTTIFDSSKVQPFKSSQNGNIQFRLRSKANKNVSIKVLRVTLSRGNDLELNTGFTINQRDWAKTPTARQNNTENRIIF